MKIVFHEKYHDSTYANDPAAKEGRINAIEHVIRPHYEFIVPKPASSEQIRLNHSQNHLEHIQQNPELYDMALLAAGGALKAANLAMNQEPSFALIRPPGHHASYDSCWGFCFFNNIAIAIKHLLYTNQINSAVIIDFDLHLGDGTRNAFQHDDRVHYYSGNGNTASKYIKNLETRLENYSSVDMLGVSAGFDLGEDDWGDLLSKQDYRYIGQILKQFAQKSCQNCRFAVLEGGYNHQVLGKHVLAFLKGFD